MSNTCVEVSFRDKVWEIFKCRTSPLTTTDIKHILVTQHQFPSSMSQRSIHNACVAFVDKGWLSRTEDKIESACGIPNTRRSYGYVRSIPVDTDQVLWVVRDHSFNDYEKPVPKKILYTAATRYIVAAMAGKYIGAERIECELKSNEFYESKGWMVLS